MMPASHQTHFRYNKNNSYTNTVAVVVVIILIAIGTSLRLPNGVISSPSGVDVDTTTTALYTTNAFIVVPSPIIATTKVSTERRRFDTVKIRNRSHWLYQTTPTNFEIVDTATTTTTGMSPVVNIPPISRTAKRIFWIRHGEVINPGAAQNRTVFYGSQNVPLSSFGQQEAIAAAQFIVDLQQQQQATPPMVISKVFSSNLTRAIYGAEQVRLLLLQQQQQTANQTTEVVPVPNSAEQVAGFMELNRGDWAGKTIEEIGIDNMERFNQGDETVTPNNGESYRAFNHRVLEARNKIVLPQIPLGQCGVVVSHLQVTRCIVGNTLQVPISEISKLSIATASITCIDYEYKDNNDDDGTTTVMIDENESTTMATPKSQIIHFQSYKPNVGLRKSMDGAN
jgi:broad specificity phosphatase PhoE